MQVFFGTCQHGNVSTFYGGRQQTNNGQYSNISSCKFFVKLILFYASAPFFKKIMTTFFPIVD